MKKLICILLLILVCSVACADEWTITPSVPDLFPNDGFMTPGSMFNPYEVTDSYGNVRGTMESQVPDLYPDDGFMDAGSSANPYVIDWDN